MIKWTVHPYTNEKYQTYSVCCFALCFFPANLPLFRLFSTLFPNKTDNAKRHMKYKWLCSTSSPLNFSLYSTLSRVHGRPQNIEIFRTRLAKGRICWKNNFCNFHFFPPVLRILTGLQFEIFWIIFEIFDIINWVRFLNNSFCCYLADDFVSTCNSYLYFFLVLNITSIL